MTRPVKLPTAAPASEPARFINDVIVLCIAIAFGLVDKDTG